MDTILGPDRAAVSPSIAPGLAALIARPALGLVPGQRQRLGLVLAVAAPLWAVAGRGRA